MPTSKRPLTTRFAKCAPRGGVRGQKNHRKIRVARYLRVRTPIDSAEIGWRVNRMGDRATMLVDLKTLDVSPDPADHFLFAMAKAGGAAHLVTGDQCGFLTIDKYPSTKIVTARRMVEILSV